MPCGRPEPIAFVQAFSTRPKPRPLFLQEPAMAGSHSRPIARSYAAAAFRVLPSLARRFARAANRAGSRQSLVAAKLIRCAQPLLELGPFRHAERLRGCGIWRASGAGPIVAGDTGKAEAIHVASKPKIGCRISGARTPAWIAGGRRQTALPRSLWNPHPGPSQRRVRAPVGDAESSHTIRPCVGR